MTVLDRYFDTLADESRRRLLLSLAEDNPQHIDHRYARKPADQQYHIEMHHVHLPKLVDVGLINWDRQTEEITRGPAFEDIEPLMDCLLQERAEKNGQ